MDLDDIILSNEEKETLRVSESTISNKTFNEKSHNREVIENCATIAGYVINSSANDNTLDINQQEELNALYKRVGFRKSYKTSFRKRVILIVSSVASLAIITYVLIGGVSKNDNIVVFEANTQTKNVLLLENASNDNSIKTISKINSIDYTTKDYTAKDHTTKLAVAASTLSKLIVPRGKTFTVILSDSSEVIINADSKFSYPANFEGDKREVYLVGEAFFKVKKDKRNRPFIVKTNNVEINVLGTEFNVCGYLPDNTSVTLIDGSVKITDTISRNYVNISPNESAVISENGDIDVEKNVDIDEFSNNMEGHFYFDNKNLFEISQTIGRWYNIDIEFEQDGIGDIRMHFVADKFKPIEHLVSLLNNTNCIKAEYNNGKLVLGRI